MGYGFCVGCGGIAVCLFYTHWMFDDIYIYIHVIACEIIVEERGVKRSM